MENLTPPECAVKYSKTYHCPQGLCPLAGFVCSLSAARAAASAEQAIMWPLLLAKVKLKSSWRVLSYPVPACKRFAGPWRTVGSQMGAWPWCDCWGLPARGREGCAGHSASAP